MNQNAASAHSDEFVPFKLGAVIRKRRKELALTLHEVALRSGLSIAFISQVERGQTIPSLMSLYHISEALRIEMSELLRVAKKSVLYRRAAAPEYLSVQSRIAYIKLSNRYPNQKLDALIMEIPPRYQSVAQQGEGKDGEALLFVDRGRIDIAYDGKQFKLGKGDSMHYKLNKTLEISNATTSTARALWVGSVVLY